VSQRIFIRGALLALPLLAAPLAALACACGCGVFDVSTAAMLPGRSGGMLFLEEDFIDQNRNYSGSSRAPAADNEDKQVRTWMTTIGGNYSFSPSWNVAVKLPFWQRHFVTTDEDTGDVVGFDHGALGDVRIAATWSGLSADHSTGLVIGLKLPTGDYTYANFDRDTEIGTGTTDTLLGIWHQGNLSVAWRLNWFAQAQWQRALAERDGYRPGNDLNVALGGYYEGSGFGNGVKLVPMLQLIFSSRGRDGGDAGKPDETGYTRTLLAPGLEVRLGSWKAYADVALPVQQHYNGNQLAAPALYKLILSRSF